MALAPLVWIIAIPSTLAVLTSDRASSTYESKPVVRTLKATVGAKGFQAKFPRRKSVVRKVQKDMNVTKRSADDSMVQESIDRTVKNRAATSFGDFPEEETGAYKLSEDGKVVFYPAKYLLPANAQKAGKPPPMVVANEANLDPNLKKLGIDFEGIWWMSDNPLPEECVSFANAKVTFTNGNFPVSLAVPNSNKGMWSWLVTTVGTMLRQYWATLNRKNTVTGDPTGYTNFRFFNNTTGDISTGLTEVPFVWVKEFPMYRYTEDCDKTSGSLSKCDPDDCAPKGIGYTGTCKDVIKKYPNDLWSRPSIFQKGSLFPTTTYTLKRIVMGDGTPHPLFWDEFMERFTEYKKECKYGWKFWSPSCTTISGGKGEKQMQAYAKDV